MTKHMGLAYSIYIYIYVYAHLGKKYKNTTCTTEVVEPRLNPNLVPNSKPPINLIPNPVGGILKTTFPDHFTIQRPTLRSHLEFMIIMNSM